MNWENPDGRTVELRSDTFTLPTSQMLEAMAGAEIGDDVYGEDPTVRRLEETSSALFAKEAACFVPSGTMANLAAIMSHCPRGSKVIVGAESDIFVYEAGGASVCGGVVYHPVSNRRDGTMDTEAIREAFPSDPEDPQFAVPSLICVENPQNRCGGRVLSLEHLKSVSALARSKGVPVHLDGARIFNAALAAQVPVSAIALYSDSLQFCLSKGLGAPVGSVVLGANDFIAKVRRVRKMIGGGMRQAGVLAAAGLIALENVSRLADDHRRARWLAASLAGIPGVAVDPETVETNMVFFRIEDPRMDNDAFLSAAAARGVSMAELGNKRIRAVTHSGVADRDIEHAITIVRDIMEKPFS